MQKRMILTALERGKPVITATQMLESMIHDAGADAGRGERRGERGARRHVCAHAVRGDRDRRVPGARRSRRWTSSRAASSPARVPARAADAGEEPTRGAGDVECSLRYRRGAPRRGARRSDLQRRGGFGRGAAASAAAGRRDHARRARRPALASSGACVAPDRECQNVEELWSRSLEAARGPGLIEPATAS